MPDRGLPPPLALSGNSPREYFEKKKREAVDLGFCAGIRHAMKGTVVFGREAMRPHEACRGPDGRSVMQASIANHGMTAEFLSHGATLSGLWVEGYDHSLVLRLPMPAEYLSQTMYVGALVGRFANRIGHARAEIAGGTYDFDRNWLGRHILHGGVDGSGNRIWEISDWCEDALTFVDVLPDGHMGFPGTMRVEARFRIIEGTALELEVTAECDAPTLCGFAQHGYWNLDGTANALDQVLKVDASAYLPVDSDLIPTGVVKEVDGSPFDFRGGMRLSESRPVGGYDHNLCLSTDRVAPRPVAWLTGPQTGLELCIETSEPGLQLYDGAGTDGVAGLPPFAGIALEPQVWPDAPNHLGFPSALLLPGQTYRQVTRFVIRTPGAA